MSVTRHAERRVVAYAPTQLFELVADVPRYPEFLPWCQAGRIRRHESPTVQIAELAIGFGPFHEKFASRVVLVGNAAQSLHPVAGQGFNLGLRDAWELATAVRDAHDPGDPATLNAYLSERRFDRTATILFTDTLIRLFSNDIPLLDRLCGAGCAVLSSIPPAKNFLVRRMMFGVHG